MISVRVKISVRVESGYGVGGGEWVPTPHSLGWEYVIVYSRLFFLQNRKVSITIGRQHRHQRRHQSGKTSSLVEMKFHRDKKVHV